MHLDKPDVIALHTEELAAWERLLAGLSQEQATAPLQAGGWSIKDTLAHLNAWQERTIARLEAALESRPPRFPTWPVDLDAGETPQTVERANAWIWESRRALPWSEVLAKWRADYRRFLALLEAVPAADMRPGAVLDWLAIYEPLEGYPGCYDYHHAEHRVQLEDWARGRAGAAP